MSHAALKALPNSLSFSRMGLAVWCYALIASQNWEPATWVFLAGLTTDYLDGALARRFGVATKFGENVLEPLADGALVWLALYGLIRKEPTLAYILVISLAIYGLFILFIRTSKAHMFRKAFEPTIYGLATLGVVLTIAIKAGWPWLLLTLIFFIFAASLKRQRVRHHLSAWGRIRQSQPVDQNDKQAVD